MSSREKKGKRERFGKDPFDDSCITITKFFRGN